MYNEFTVVAIPPRLITPRKLTTHSIELGLGHQ